VTPDSRRRPGSIGPADHGDAGASGSFGWLLPHATSKSALAARFTRPIYQRAGSEFARA
jgi:hypothetical protein